MRVLDLKAFEDLADEREGADDADGVHCFGRLLSDLLAEDVEAAVKSMLLVREDICSLGWGERREVAEDGVDGLGAHGLVLRLESDAPEDLDANEAQVVCDEPDVSVAGVLCVDAFLPVGEHEEVVDKFVLDVADPAEVERLCLAGEEEAGRLLVEDLPRVLRDGAEESEHLGDLRACERAAHKHVPQRPDLLAPECDCLAVGDQCFRKAQPLGDLFSVRRAQPREHSCVVAHTRGLGGFLERCALVDKGVEEVLLRVKFPQHFVVHLLVFALGLAGHRVNEEVQRLPHAPVLPQVRHSKPLVPGVDAGALVPRPRKGPCDPRGNARLGSCAGHCWRPVEHRCPHAVEAPIRD